VKGEDHRRRSGYSRHRAHADAPPGLGRLQTGSAAVPLGGPRTHMYRGVRGRLSATVSSGSTGGCATVSSAWMRRRHRPQVARVGRRRGKNLVLFFPRNDWGKIPWVGRRFFNPGEIMGFGWGWAGVEYQPGVTERTWTSQWETIPSRPIHRVWTGIPAGLGLTERGLMGEEKTEGQNERQTKRSSAK
jgi:hypothetical protein